MLIQERGSLELLLGEDLFILLHDIMSALFGISIRATSAEADNISDESIQ